MHHRSFLLVVLAVWIAAGTTCGAQGGMLTVTAGSGQVTVPDNPALVPVNGITIEAWFYFNPAGPGGSFSPTILRKPSGYPSYLLRATSSGGGVLEYYINVGGVFYSVTSNVPTPINSWHHVAGTHDGQVARLYLDGLQVGSLTIAGPAFNQSGDLVIGRGANNETWHGSIDEVRIWSVARTALQIQQSMMFERDNVPGLVAAWHFNGGYTDLTGGFNGTPNSGVAIQASTSPVSAEELGAPIVTPIGGPLVFDIKSALGPLPYVMEVSVTGNSPGLFLGPPINKVFPLNEPLLHLTYGSYVPTVFDDFFGFIGPGGHASPTLNLPPAPQIIGASIWGSYVILDPAYPLGIRHVGNGTQTIIGNYAPSVASVSPSTCLTTGGSPLTIGGDHFQAGATVTIGGAPATQVMVVSVQSITCVAPALAPGAKNVTVTNQDGFSGTATNAITYFAPLAISAVTPPVALAGAQVTVSGSGFQPGLVLSLGGSPVAVTSLLPSALTFTVPAGVPCNSTLAVTNPDNQTQSMQWNASPLIVSTLNASGPAAGGGVFFIIGTNFFAGTTVTIGGANAVIQNLAPANLTVQAPPGAPGPATIVVSSISGCTATSTYLYQ